MKIVLSGEDSSKLYQRENQLLQISREQGREIVSLDLTANSEKEISEALGVMSMFGAQRIFRISGVEKQRSSKKLQDYLTALSATPDDVIITIPGKMTPAKKKAFSKEWKLESYDLPAVLFTFLESIGVKPLAQVLGLYEQALTSGSEWGLHAMVARQFRLLLAAKTGTPIAGPPFMAAKLQSQAKKFTPEQLAGVLEQLFQLEKSIKSGQTKRNWSELFDILLLKLYDELD